MHRRHRYELRFDRLWVECRWISSNAKGLIARVRFLYLFRICPPVVNWAQNMKLLFVVYLPLLPLESLRPRWSDPGRFVVMDQGMVATMSPEAVRAGVRIGMRSGGVSAVAPDTVILER